MHRMKFIETNVKGCLIIEPDRFDDDRGFFSKIWDVNEFRQHGLSTDFAQFNLAFNHRKGTLRGMHFQAVPHEEVKLVRCTRGAVFDVIVDLRRASPTYLQWSGVELSEENYRTYYVPQGCAHGYVTLTDRAEVTYNVSTGYAPQSARGVRWNDPVFGIKWPMQPTVINSRDNTYPDYERVAVGAR
jgi:dTDP-4-dehydrorhamnose 3,5-epimerase